MYPDRFINVTNGIAVRRWLKQSNPGLSALLTERLGSSWENDLEELGRLTGAADDAEFRRQFRGIKRTNKQRLADEVMRRTGVEISIDSLFDVQVKRIHEYKRQLLNLLYVVTRYRRIRENPRADVVPRSRDLCRQGGAGLRDGQGHRQAHQQCGAHHRCGSAPCATSCAWCFCRTTTSLWRRRSCPRRICRSKFPPPGWRHREPVI